MGVDGMFPWLVAGVMVLFLVVLMVFGIGQLIRDHRERADR